MEVRWLLFLLGTFQLCGQTSFRSSKYAFDTDDIKSGLAVAVIDLNGDHLDDIVSLDRLNHLKVFYQLVNTKDFYYQDFGRVSMTDQLSLSVADLDNDGTKEIIFGGIYDGLKVYKEFGASGAYLKFATTSTDFYTQNISTIDFDNDGLLDIYVNDDEGPPRFFKNTNMGDLEERKIIDFALSGEAASGNYGSIWTDFDQDGDLDLYISKCRLGVDDPTDLRRINQLFENRDDVFVDVAESLGLASGEQTWVSNFVDLDNDLDLDLVMLNHTGGNEIYENAGEGQYLKREVSTDWNRIFEGLQLVVKDFDNDGYKDIMISGVESKLFWNKGAFIFEEDKGFLSGKNARSLAVGDLNNDGWLDIYASFPENQIQENSYVGDEVFFNQGGINHFVKISLVCNEGARDAVGTKVILFDSELTQISEVRSGDSYGTSNSLDLNFGIRQGSIVDSLQVQWISGSMETYYNIDLDKHYILEEGGCITEAVSPILPENPINCLNSPFLVGLENYENVMWSSGSTDSIHEITQSGYYNATVTNANGCEVSSGLFQVVNEADLILPEIELIDPKAAYCINDGIVVRSNFENLRWSNGGTTMDIYAVAGERVYVDYELCGDLVRSEDLEINVLEVDTPKYTVDTILKGEEAFFEAEGEYVSWYPSWESGTPLFIGNDFNFGAIDQDFALYAENQEAFSQYDSVGYPYDESTAGYTGGNINGGLIFSVESYQTRLETVQCFTDIEAVRNFQIKDYWGNTIAEKEVLLSPGNSNVNLGFTLNPAKYYLLTTDPNQNFSELGTRSPRLLRSNAEGNIYPISSNRKNVNLLASTGTSDVYYYFYDMVFQDYDLACTSDRVEVTVYVDQESGIGDLSRNKFSVLPNPVLNTLRVEGLEGGVLSYEVYDISGRKAQSGKLSKDEIEVNGLKAGLYILRIMDNAVRFVKK